jgi:hypothetical protein
VVQGVALELLRRLLFIGISDEITTGASLSAGMLATTEKI